MPAPNCQDRFAAREPLVAEHIMTNKFAVYIKNIMDKLPLDTVWTWLVSRKPLVAEEAEAETYATHTERKSG